MKKGVLIFAVSVILAALATSCKVVEPCPAYGQVEQASSDSIDS